MGVGFGCKFRESFWDDFLQSHSARPEPVSLMDSFDFFICCQAFHCQQVFLTRMTRRVRIKHAYIPFGHGLVEGVFKEVLSILESDFRKHFFNR